ncbi:sensor histidine kinase [Methanolobus profundi]|uniref:histidine kinase n=1 Tax=Methanolobus profundi TaxID=487685 RepID=A0A1I4UA52_9EURY|nr:HAMP domain-containing sensor histidine kinase [Methanolobus profundi]SFM85795.1 His Kinase A (phospho-acceptor) domain-containing protein [Methanolobus profundi]
MDLRSINSRKEALHRRIILDAVLIIAGMTFVLFILFLVGTSGTLHKARLPCEEWIIIELLVTMVLLVISSWLFSFRRCTDIKNAVKEFNSIDAIKEEFISNLRHELKTPLVPIKGYSELLFDGTLGEMSQKQKEAVNKIKVSSERLERLIDSLIFISVAKYGDLEYTFTTLRLEDIITSTISELLIPLKQKEQKLETNIQPGLQFIEGDRKFLKEAVSQILENAIKFSPKGGTILLTVNEGYKSLHIKIIDKGIGIPEEEIENIFQRFYQIDGSKTRRYGGNGLGLHIARTITEAHNGSIWIESVLGEGTTVHIRLPTPKDGKIKE